MLVGPLGGTAPTIWVSCLFADPIADIAVLGSTDIDELADEMEAYDTFTETISPLPICKARSCQGWILGLDSQWISTKVDVRDGIWGSSLTIDATEAGMSGSPILNKEGQAIGVVVLGTETVDGDARKNERASGQPILVRTLPGWFLSPPMFR